MYLLSRKRLFSRVTFCYPGSMHTVTIVDTPFILDALGHLRDKTTPTSAFRQYSDNSCYELMSHAFSSQDSKQKNIQTPVGSTNASFLSHNFIFVTILRAGLAMLPSVLSLMPDIPVGFVGLARDEQTAIASEYYAKLPEITKESVIILGDPMLATGGSLIHTIELLSKYQPKEIRVVCVIAAPEGIELLQEKFPDISIITASVDSHLNDKKYIVPGLGDYGDRYFGTI